jgi:hypothetical protein
LEGLIGRKLPIQYSSAILGSGRFLGISKSAKFAGAGFHPIGFISGRIIDSELSTDSGGIAMPCFIFGIFCFVFISHAKLSMDS